MISRPSVAVTMPAQNASRPVSMIRSVAATSRAAQKSVPLRPSKLTAAEQRDDEGDEPWLRLDAGDADERRTPAEDAPAVPLSHLPRRELRHEAGVDAEDLGPVQPRVSSVAAHARDGEDRVADADRGDQPRRRRGRVHQLTPRHTEHQQGRRPQSPAGRVRARGAWLRADQPSDRRPRIELTPDVAEQHAQRHKADPPDDEDRQRRDVVVERRRAERCGGDHEHRRCQDEASERCHDRPCQDELERRGRRPPRQRGPARLRPADRERPERHDDHGRGGIEEHRDRNRRIRTSLDAVGVRGGGRHQRGERGRRGARYNAACHCSPVPPVFAGASVL